MTYPHIKFIFTNYLVVPNFNLTEHDIKSSLNESMTEERRKSLRQEIISLAGDSKTSWSAIAIKTGFWVPSIMHAAKEPMSDEEVYNYFCLLTSDAVFPEKEMSENQFYNLFALLYYTLRDQEIGKKGWSTWADLKSKFITFDPQWHFLEYYHLEQLVDFFQAVFMIRRRLAREMNPGYCALSKIEGVKIWSDPQADKLFQEYLSEKPGVLIDPAILNWPTKDMPFPLNL